MYMYVCVYIYIIYMYVYIYISALCGKGDSRRAKTPLLVYEALSYECMRPSATSVWGFKLQVYEALSY